LAFKKGGKKGQGWAIPSRGKKLKKGGPSSARSCRKNREDEGGTTRAENVTGSKKKVREVLKPTVTPTPHRNNDIKKIGRRNLPR